MSSTNANSLNASAPVFISYSRADNEGDWVTILVDQLQRQYLADGSPVPLNVFFDVKSIRGGDDWETKILENLKAARAFIAILTPGFFASDWCRREWDWWTRHEMHRHSLRDGAAPIYYITVPGFRKMGPTDASHLPPEDIARWIVGQSLGSQPISEIAQSEIIRTVTKLREREPYDLRPFTAQILQELAEQSLKDKLLRLSQHVRDLLDRAIRAERSPTDLPNYNPAFTGRVDSLLKLRQDLACGAAGITAVVHGLGGIGKTELALAYAHAYAHEYPGGRYLLPCAGAVDWRGALSRFAELHGWWFPDEVKKDAGIHLKRLIERLHAFVAARGRCLLLCDNVDQMALLRQGKIAELRIRDDRFHLLFTTRLPQPADIGPTANIHWHPLDSLPLNDATELLQTIVHACPESERPVLADLARELGGFTIAVELTGRYLANNPMDSPSALLARLRAAIFPELGEKAEHTGPDLFRHGEEARLDFILGQTLATLMPEEIRVLEYAAQMSPDAVPLAWVRELLAADFSQFASNHGSHADKKWFALLENLFSVRLLLRENTRATAIAPPDKEGAPGEVIAVATIHRLVQDLLRNRSGERAKHIRRSLVDLLKENSYERRESWHESHHTWFLTVIEVTADSWLARAERGESNLLDEAVFAANEAAGILSFRAEWPRAEPLLRRAMHLLNQQVGTAGIERTPTINNLGQLLQDTDRFAEAEALIRVALEIDEQNFGQVDPRIAIRLNNLALLLEQTGRLKEAEECMRRALTIDEATYGPDHPVVARDLGNLVMILQDMKRLAEAEPLIRRALSIEEQVFGRQHPNVAIQVNNLATLLQDTNRLDEAEKLIRRALSIDELVMGPDHPKVGIRLNNLGQILHDMGRNAEAEQLTRRALAIAERAHGPEHTDVAITLNNLAMLLLDADETTEAEKLIRRALAIDEKLLGTKHPSVARDINNLASVLQCEGRLSEAEPLMRQALAINKAIYGPDHPEFATALGNLALLLQGDNRLADAEPLMRRHLSIFALFTSRTGHEHPHLQDAKQYYHGLLKATGLTEAKAKKRVLAALRDGGLGGAG